MGHIGPKLGGQFGRVGGLVVYSYRPGGRYACATQREAAGLLYTRLESTSYFT